MESLYKKALLPLVMVKKLKLSGLGFVFRVQREKVGGFDLLKVRGIMGFLKCNHKARQSRSDSTKILQCSLTKMPCFKLNNTMLMI